MAEQLAGLSHCMWRKETIPQEFKDASIIHLYKVKSLQTEPKANPVCASMRQPQRHLSFIDCWKDTGKKNFEPPECAS